MADQNQTKDSKQGGQNDPNRDPKAPDPEVARQSGSASGERKPDSTSDMNRPK